MGWEKVDEIHDLGYEILVHYPTGLCISIIIFVFQIFVNQSFTSEPLPETNATISLPSVLRNFFPERNKTRVQFQFYGTENLFQVYSWESSHFF